LEREFHNFISVKDQNWYNEKGRLGQRANALGKKVQIEACVGLDSLVGINNVACF